MKLQDTVSKMYWRRVIHSEVRPVAGKNVFPVRVGERGIVKVVVERMLFSVVNQNVSRKKSVTMEKPV